MVVFWSRCRITLSQRCHNVAFPTLLLQPKANVVFSTSVFRPGINVAATSWFWFCFPDENLNMFQYHCNFLFPKMCNIALQFHFLIKKKNYSVCVNAKRLFKWWIFENLELVAWTEKRDFWSRVVHWSEKAPCLNSVRLWFNYFLRSGNQNTGV